MAHASSTNAVAVIESDTIRIMEYFGNVASGGFCFSTKLHFVAVLKFAQEQWCSNCIDVSPPTNLGQMPFVELPWYRAGCLPLELCWWSDYLFILLRILQIFLPDHCFCSFCSILFLHVHSTADASLSACVVTVEHASEEAWQAPDFDEYVLVLEGKVELLHSDGTVVKVVSGAEQRVASCPD
jgi:hypothetical protein